jgi:hypothetical protein
MDVKSAGEFENLESVGGRREGRLNIEALRKSSQKNTPKRYESAQRNLNAIDALRTTAKEKRLSHYSIYSLSEVLFSLGYEDLTPWRYASKVKTAFYQMALREVELAENSTKKPDGEKLRLVPFVFNLSHAIQQAMLNSKRPEVTCCKDKITRALNKATGRAVEFWFQYEMAPMANKGKPHIQGAMLLSMNELKLVRRALHKINGKVDANFKRHAIRFGLKKRYELASDHGFLFTDLNWASYCAKETGRTRLTFVDQNTDSAGQVVAASRSLNGKSKLIFEKLRTALQHSTQQLITL